MATGPNGFPEAVANFYTGWGWPQAWRHSGYHFADIYGVDPESAYRRANAGDAAIGVWRQVGEALADTIARLASETGTAACVVAGGLATAWRFIEPSLRFRVAPRGVRVMRTAMEHPSLSGAAALFTPSESA